MRISPPVLLLAVLTGTLGAQTTTTIRVAVILQDVLVPDLTASDFVIKEDGKPSAIRSFTQDKEPASIGLVVDRSNSMRQSPLQLLPLIRVFLESVDSRDEIFLVEFNDGVTLTRSFTQDHAVLLQDLEKGRAGGGSAAVDAIARASDQLAKTARHRNRLLVVFSGGDDNLSLSSTGALDKTLRRSNIAVHLLLIPQQLQHDNPLRQFVDASGGRMVSLDTSQPRAEPQVREFARGIHMDYLIEIDLLSKPSPSKRNIDLNVAPKGSRVRIRHADPASFDLR